MPFTTTPFVLTADQRTDLETRVRSGRGRADAARRARVLLLLADGCSYATVAERTGCSSRTIALWKQRFMTDGVAGLTARHRGSKADEDPVVGMHFTALPALIACHFLL